MAERLFKKRKGELDMEDFYKDFKDRIEGRPEPDFRSEDWADMESRLDNKKSFPIPLYWLWAAIPLIFISLSGWNWSLQKALSNKEADLAAAVVLRDTVVVEKVVFKTDTIYKDRYKDRVEYVALPPKVIEKFVYFKENDNGDFVEVIPEDEVVYSQKGYQIKSNLVFGNSISESKKSLSPSFGDNSDGSIGESDRILLNSIESFEMLPLASTFIENSSIKSGGPKDILFSPFLNLRKLSKEHSVRNNFFSPRALSLSFGYGLSNASSKEMQHKFGYTLTAESKLRFDPGYRLWVNASLQNMRFQSNVMGDDIGVPVVSPPSDQFDFENAQVPRRAVQFSVGLDYVFLPKNRIRPVLGLGISGVQYYKTEIVYDFVNRDNGVEFIFEKSAPDAAMRVNYALLKLGMEYSLSRRFNLEASAFYRNGMDDVFRINSFLEGRVSLSARIF